nr:MAG TPA: hypothetical protein [Caudoviricetes sp.]
MHFIFQDIQEPFRFELNVSPPYSLDAAGVSYHHRHREDIHPEIRSIINLRLEIPLANAYKTTTEKELYKALSLFYHTVFPEAIKAIIEVESKYMGQKVTDEYTKSLLEEFYRAMDEIPNRINLYIGQVRHYYFYNNGCKCTIPTDRLFLEIIESKMALYSGMAKMEDPGPELHSGDKENYLDIPCPSGYCFIGTDYRKQIIEHVALFWEMFMLYYVIVGKGDNFTIPENERYYPGKRYKPKVSLDYYSEWMEKPLEEKIVSLELNHFDLLKEDAKFVGGFAEINPDHLDPEDREKYCS